MVGVVVQRGDVDTAASGGASGRASGAASGAASTVASSIPRAASARPWAGLEQPATNTNPNNFMSPHIYGRERTRFKPVSTT